MEFFQGFGHGDTWDGLQGTWTMVSHLAGLTGSLDFGFHRITPGDFSRILVSALSLDLDSHTKVFVGPIVHKSKSS